MTEKEKMIEACKRIIEKKDCLGDEEDADVFCGNDLTGAESPTAMPCPGQTEDAPEWWDCSKSAESAKRYLEENKRDE